MKKETKIIFVGGKGGVGKSTSAAAIAFLHARQRKNTLLVSTDPAHNLGDIFYQKLNNEAVKVHPYLSAIEIDSAIEVRKYINKVKKNVRGVVKPTMHEEVTRQLDSAGSSPGAEEAALFDRITEIILDEAEKYDLLIFDTAPTGHMIRLLTLPELMSVWVDGMLKRRQKRNEMYSNFLNDGETDDSIYQILQNRKRRYSAIRSILLNKSRTEFIFTLNPERLPILETKKAIQLLAQHQITVNTLFINKVLVNEVEGEFWTKRKENEKVHLIRIEKEFTEQEKVYIPLFETDIISVTLLERYANHLENTYVFN